MTPQKTSKQPASSLRVGNSIRISAGWQRSYFATILDIAPVGDRIAVSVRDGREYPAVTRIHDFAPDETVLAR